MVVLKRITVGVLSTNCYVVYNDETKEGFIVDPADQADKLEREITAVGVKIQAILLTHGHFDHIGAAEQLKQKYAVSIYAHEKEEEILKQPQFNMSPVINKHIGAKADVLLKDNQELEMGNMKIKVIHTPGHTQGCCCYYIKDSNILLSGDTLFYCSHGRTDFPTGSEAEITKSIREKLLVLPNNTSVYPGHGAFTTIADEKKWY